MVAMKDDTGEKIYPHFVEVRYVLELNRFSAEGYSFVSVVRPGKDEETTDPLYLVVKSCTDSTFNSDLAKLARLAP